MKEAFIFLTDGFEEIEAIATIDILRRAEINVTAVSLSNQLEVTGGHNITVRADALFSEIDPEKGTILILPGGTVKINEHDGLKSLVAKFCAEGKLIAAICAAPMVLGGLGLLRGRRATAYPGFEKYIVGAEFVVDSVVVDGNIITGRGPGLTMEFALQIVEMLCSKPNRDQVAAGLLL